MAAIDHSARRPDAGHCDAEALRGVKAGRARLHVTQIEYWVNQRDPLVTLSGPYGLLSVCR